MDHARTPGEFTFGALAVGGVVVLAFGNGIATGEPALTLLAATGIAVLVVGVVGACLALRAATVSVSGPTDATCGETIDWRVEVRGRGRTCSVRILDPPSDWYDTAARDGAIGGSISWLVPRRGLFSQVRVELRTSWPIGVFLRRRVLVVRLPRVLHAAPRPLAMPYLRAAVSQAASATSPTAGAGGDTARTVRPYVAGDPRRLVHWPTTARTGELAVRELEPPAADGIAVRLVLGPDPVVAERAAGHARGLGDAVLRAGDVLLLSTCERGRAVVEVVGTRRGLARRLARATAGDPPQLPVGWRSVELSS